jgi:catechol 2,3-dioxygenase-like lactoylglutathione lyase family enzyme
MKPPVIHSVTTLLEVFDMPASLAFYRALGCEVVQHWGEGESESDWDWVFLKLGDAGLMLNTAYERDERPATPDSARAKGHIDTELYFECDDLDSVCEYLRSNGIDTPQPQTTFYGTRRIHLTDPDGFLVWFQATVNR